MLPKVLRWVKYMKPLLVCRVARSRRTVGCHPNCSIRSVCFGFTGWSYAVQRWAYQPHFLIFTLAKREVLLVTDCSALVLVSVEVWT